MTRFKNVSPDENAPKDLDWKICFVISVIGLLNLIARRMIIMIKIE
jgi:hypothetical protein